jgi:hypothetical protein
MIPQEYHKRIQCQFYYEPPVNKKFKHLCYNINE